jgi:hypothetical protein
METEQSLMMVTLRYGALTYVTEALVTLLASAVVKATLLAPVSTFFLRRFKVHLITSHKYVFKVFKKNKKKVSKAFHWLQP